MDKAKYSSANTGTQLMSERDVAKRKPLKLSLNFGYGGGDYWQK
jgi:hypothetical protein